MSHSNHPLPRLAPSLLTWRTSFFARGGEYPSTFVPGLPTTAPPFASSPTLSHPTDQVNIFTKTTSTKPAVLVWHNTVLYIPNRQVQENMYRKSEL